MIPVALDALIEQAKFTNKGPGYTISTLLVTILTPVEQIQALGVTGFAGIGDYLNVTGNAETIQIRIRIQPGLYQNRIVPYADALEVEVLDIIGLEQTATRYRCFISEVGEMQAAGNTTAQNSPEIFDATNFVEVTMQLVPIDYDILKNVTISNNFLMCDVYNALHSTLVEYCTENPLLEGDDKKSVNIELPLDNEELYNQVMIRQGIKLKDLVKYLQQNYGVYATGAGLFFKFNTWYVYSLYNTQKYTNSTRVLDIIRVPEDAIPTLEHSFYTDGTNVTIIATGPSGLIDRRTIAQENEGTGKQVISAASITGATGTHYNNGRAIHTREDAVSEYRTVERRDENDYIELDPNPTDNICARLSENAPNLGQLLQINWTNADPSLIVPGMAVRYHYLVDDQTIKVRQGQLVGSSWRYEANGVQPVLQFRKSVGLSVFLGDEELDE